MTTLDAVSLVGRPATEIAAAVRAGQVTALDVARAHLARIAAVDPQIGAFRSVRAQAALVDAAAVDAVADKSGLALAGVPVAVKDNLPVAGESRRNGSAGSSPEAARADHPTVARVKAAGGVVLGMTHVPELCVFGATDSVFGTTRNPWDLARTPGGSSGGSAAAVAAGLVPLAIGNDGMGSIRIPAGCCGLVGIKPGLGLVPSGLGAHSWFDMAENGPLATTVADTALLLGVLAGRDVAAQPPPPGLRVAVSTRTPAAGVRVDREHADAAHRVGALLAGQGHLVRHVDPPYGFGNLADALLRWMAGVEDDAEAELEDRSLMERRTARHAAAGRFARRTGLLRDDARERWLERVRPFFGDVDVLVTPVLATPPISSARWSERGWLRNVAANALYAPYAASWNLAGWPASAVPAGVHTGAGTPLSVQLVTPPGGEALQLGLAAVIEQAAPWPRHAPVFTRAV